MSVPTISGWTFRDGLPATVRIDEVIMVSQRPGARTVLHVRGCSAVWADLPYEEAVQRVFGSAAPPAR